ncbi:hypothetical protein ACFX12_015423 [Malus domestica]
MNQTDRTSATVDCSSPKMRIREGQEISPDDVVEEIGSSTERSAVALEKRGKMLAAKPKFGIGRNRVEVQVKLRSQVFKVYTESDTAKADAGSRTCAAVNEVWTQENAAAFNAGLKSMEKRKGILGSSAANANVVRRALADVSNVKSNSSRFVGVMPRRKLGFNGYIR